MPYRERKARIYIHVNPGVFIIQFNFDARFTGKEYRSHYRQEERQHEREASLPESKRRFFDDSGLTSRTPPTRILGQSQLAAPMFDWPARSKTKHRCATFIHVLIPMWVMSAYLQEEKCAHNTADCLYHMTMAWIYIQKYAPWLPRCQPCRFRSCRPNSSASPPPWRCRCVWLVGSSMVVVADTYTHAYIHTSIHA